MNTISGTDSPSVSSKSSKKSFFEQMLFEKGIIKQTSSGGERLSSNQSTEPSFMEKFLIEKGAIKKQSPENSPKEKMQGQSSIEKLLNQPKISPAEQLFSSQPVETSSYMENFLIEKGAIKKSLKDSVEQPTTSYMKKFLIEKGAIKNQLSSQPTSYMEQFLIEKGAIKKEGINPPPKIALAERVLIITLSDDLSREEKIRKIKEEMKKEAKEQLTYKSVKEWIAASFRHIGYLTWYTGTLGISTILGYSWWYGLTWSQTLNAILQFTTNIPFSVGSGIFSGLPSMGASVGVAIGIQLATNYIKKNKEVRVLLEKDILPKEHVKKAFDKIGIKIDPPSLSVQDMIIPIISFFASVGTKIIFGGGFYDAVGYTIFEKALPKAFSGTMYIAGKGAETITSGSRYTYGKMLDSSKYVYGKMSSGSKYVYRKLTEKQQKEEEEKIDKAIGEFLDNQQKISEEITDYLLNPKREKEEDFITTKAIKDILKNEGPDVKEYYEPISITPKEEQAISRAVEKEELRGDFVSQEDVIDAEQQQIQISKKLQVQKEELEMNKRETEEKYNYIQMKIAEKLILDERKRSSDQELLEKEKFLNETENIFSDLEKKIQEINKTLSSLERKKSLSESESEDIFLLKQKKENLYKQQKLLIERYKKYKNIEEFEQPPPEKVVGKKKRRFLGPSDDELFQMDLQKEIKNIHEKLHFEVDIRRPTEEEVKEFILKNPINRDQVKRFYQNKIKELREFLERGEVSKSTIEITEEKIIECQYVIYDVDNADNLQRYLEDINKKLLHTRRKLEDILKYKDAEIMRRKIQEVQEQRTALIKDRKEKVSLLIKEKEKQTKRKTELENIFIDIEKQENRKEYEERVKQREIDLKQKHQFLKEVEEEIESLEKYTNLLKQSEDFLKNKIIKSPKEKEEFLRKQSVIRQDIENTNEKRKLLIEKYRNYQRIENLLPRLDSPVQESLSVEKILQHSGEANLNEDELFVLNLLKEKEELEKLRERIQQENEKDEIEYAKLQEKMGAPENQTQEEFLTVNKIRRDYLREKFIREIGELQKNITDENKEFLQQRIDTLKKYVSYINELDLISEALEEIMKILKSIDVDLDELESQQVSMEAAKILNTLERKTPQNSQLKKEKRILEKKLREKGMIQQEPQKESLSILPSTKAIVSTICIAATFVAFGVSGRIEDVPAVLESMGINSTMSTILGKGIDFVATSEGMKTLLMQKSLSCAGIDGLINTFSEFLSPGQKEELTSFYKASIAEKDDTVLRSIYNRMFGILVGGYRSAKDLDKMGGEELLSLFKYHYPNHNGRNISRRNIQDHIVRAQSQRMALLRNIVSMSFNFAIAAMATKAIGNALKGIDTQISSELPLKPGQPINIHPDNPPPPIPNQPQTEEPVNVGPGLPLPLPINIGEETEPVIPPKPLTSLDIPFEDLQNLPVDMKGFGPTSSIPFGKPETPEIPSFGPTPFVGLPLEDIRGLPVDMRGFGPTQSQPFGYIKPDTSTGPIPLVGTPFEKLRDIPVDMDMRSFGPTQPVPFGNMGEDLTYSIPTEPTTTLDPRFYFDPSEDLRPTLGPDVAPRGYLPFLPSQPMSFPRKFNPLEDLRPTLGPDIAPRGYLPFLPSQPMSFPPRFNPMEDLRPTLGPDIAPVDYLPFLPSQPMSLRVPIDPREFFKIDAPRIGPEGPTVDIDKFLDPKTIDYIRENLGDVEFRPIYETVMDASKDLLISIPSSFLGGPLAPIIRGYTMTTKTLSGVVTTAKIISELQRVRQILKNVEEGVFEKVESTTSTQIDALGDIVSRLDITNLFEVENTRDNLSEILIRAIYNTAKLGNEATSTSLANEILYGVTFGLKALNERGQDMEHATDHVRQILDMANSIAGLLQQPPTE